MTTHPSRRTHEPTTRGGDSSRPTAAVPAARASGIAALESVIERVVQTMGYELVLVEWSSSGRHRRLRVFLDHPDGIGLDDCTRLSPIISNALDAAEADPATPEVARLLDGAYVLEVSSPGLDRPLVRRSHFERFVGHRATVRTAAPLYPGANQRNFHGVIAGVEPDPSDPDDDRAGIVCLDVPEDGAAHRIPLALVHRANLVYEG